MDQTQINRSRRLIGLVVTSISLVLVLAAGAAAQGKQDFTLHNATGKVISEVYVSPNTVNDWEEDVLEEDVLGNGESVDISFSRTEKADFWDLKVVFSDGKSAIWGKLNLSQLTDLTISFKNGKPWATWKNGG